MNNGVKTLNNQPYFALRLVVVCFIMTACGCTSLPTPRFEQVVYDYQVKPTYALTSDYKAINVTLGDKGGSLPEKTFQDESIKFKWTPSSRAAQIAVYINLSNSFLIGRDDAIKKEVIFDDAGKGSYMYTEVQRAYIRTHYTVEVVDNLKDSLINQVNSAGNFTIETELSNDVVKNKAMIKQQYYKKLDTARNQLIKDIWQDLKTHHLAEIQTNFGQVKDKVVSDLPIEPKFKQAYQLLKSNRKRNALKALKIYNLGMAQYKEKEDRLSMLIKQHLDHGITVSSKIANHEYPDRYK